MLDEVPMLWAALTTTYIMLEDGPTPNGKYGPYLPWALVLWGVFTSAAVALSSGTWQFFLFHISFGSAEIFSLYGSYCIHQRRAVDPTSPTRLLFRVGMSAYALGIVVWQADLLHCAWLTHEWPRLTGLPNPQFHAWWHLFVSVRKMTCLALTLHRYSRTQHARLMLECR